MPPWIKKTKKGICLNIWVSPNAGQTKINGLYGNHVRLAVKAPAVDGKANQAVVEALAKILRIKKNEIEIVTGKTGRNKQIAIKLSEEEIVAKIMPEL